MPEFEYGFCRMNDIQDGICGHSTLVIYYLIASTFHKWIIFIKISPKFEYVFCAITKILEIA